MKLITFLDQEKKLHIGWIKGDAVYSIKKQSENSMPEDMLTLLQNNELYMDQLNKLVNQERNADFSVSDIQLMAPLPNPTSVRDFMAFEEHIVNASKNSGLTVNPEWYEIPAFYFSNHQAIHGPNQKVEIPPNCEAFDYELEIAVVIGKEGKNISADQADDYIFGYTILNDWSARDLQLKEMKIGLGPAKGKDAATSIGPYIVTKDELAQYKSGKGYNLEMTAKVNDQLLSKGNFSAIHYSFGQMIERASAGVTLFPGDIIGSGTVGTGCILELGTEIQPWLQPGDVVELEITELGILKSEVK